MESPFEIGDKAPSTGFAAGLAAWSRRGCTLDSIEFEGGFVVLPEGGILIFLSQITVADGKNVELVSHEATERVLRRAHDGFAADVEARVDKDGAARAFLES